METETGAVGIAVGRMEIVVRGRNNVVVPEHYRQLVAEKLAKVERYDQKIIRADVELQHERNPRQNGSCQHVEITCRTRGPVVRSEACAEDFYKALDIAAERLERRMRQAADRRRVHPRPPHTAVSCRRDRRSSSASPSQRRTARQLMTASRTDLAEWCGRRCTQPSR